MFKIRHLLPIMMTLFISAIPARGFEPVASIDGVSFALAYETGNEKLKLRGVATLRYLKFIKAYAGGLYMPAETGSGEVLSDVPKRLVLEYFQSIEAEDFAEATRAMIEENTDAATLENISPALNELCLAYRSVQPKDRYALTYAPDKGLELSLNDTPLGTWQGADFARAMFSIWIGANPIDKTFRNDLLGPKR